MPDVEFGVLGPLEIKVGGVLVALGTPKQRAALAALAVSMNRVVSLDALIEAIWEERLPEGARSTVQTYVYNLRGLLTAAGADPHQILASASPGYRLSAPDDHWDLGRFRAGKNAGLAAAAAGQFEQASRHLTAALSEWRGPVLEGLREFRFAEAFARAQAEDKLVTHTFLAEAEIACGRAVSVIGDLEALAEEYPHREPLWAQLITAYYAAERQSDALDAYHRLKAVLSDDLGIDPGLKVRSLFNRILHQLPLDTPKAAQASAERTLLEEAGADSVVAVLRDPVGRIYPLTGTATRIGRSSDNEIVLPDTKVSRHHALISTDAGTFVISDLGSANGVHVRGRRISSATTLTPGDRIRIGSYEFTLEL